MSLLHPDEWDEEIAQQHTHDGWNKAIRRCMRLRALLEEARERLNMREDGHLLKEIQTALDKTFYDESAEMPPNWTGKT